jgi:predicted enzyme related to lactoylglutathione lyase
MKVREFTAIRISSPDVQKSRDWYEKFFSISPTEDSKKFVSFKINGVAFDISEADDKSPYSTGGSVGYWLVDDMETAMGNAKRIGAEIYRGPLLVKEVNRRIVQIKDPIGNVFGLEAEA